MFSLKYYAALWFISVIISVCVAVPIALVVIWLVNKFTNQCTKSKSHEIKLPNWRL